MLLLLPKISGRGDKARRRASNRLAEALRRAAAPRPPNPATETARRRSSSTPRFTFSDRERLQRADFETMTTAEFELAKRLAAEVPLPVAPVRRRRHERAAARRPPRPARDDAAHGAPAADPGAGLHAAAHRDADLVVLLDISGSMDRYARLLLHYVHGLTRRYLKVHTLTFGTRLTNITRSLRHRDPDVALEQADAQVQDWKGGTRIASCLDEFNRHWARRLLGANAALLLVTDGLDRDEHGDLGRAAAAAAAPRAPDRLAQSAAALRRLRAARGRRARAAAARRPLPARAQSGEPRRPRGARSASRRPALPPHLSPLNRMPWNCKANDSSRHPSTRPGPR